MQIEKYVHITKTPTGALVSFAGQVCLTISHYEGSDSYFWRASPMFLKLTTGANAFEVPQSYTSHSSMAEAVADGLTKLDELGAFYGVIDLPEDTHGQVSEEFDAADEAMLAESFVVRKTEKKRGVKSRIMISAAAVLGRASELAKEAGEKSGPKWVKMAHKEFSAIKAEGEEFVQYEDAIVDALASIKEDCRAEAMSMSDSLLEAQQLAGELFEDIAEEYMLNEVVNADHYHATSEPSQFGGFRPKVVHKTKGTTMYLGQYGYKTKAAATDGAKAYLDAYAKIGDMAASRAVAAHASKHPDYIKEEVLDEARFGMDDIAVGGTVIYKTLKGDHKMSKVRNKGNGFALHLQDGSTIQNHAVRSTDASDWNQFKDLKEEVLDEATRPLSGDAYWKSKEVESKEEYLKAQRKALGLPEPVKRGRGKPTNIDRDLLKTRAHSNVEAGKRPTAGFDRNEKIHFVRHLKNHPDFADKHVSQAGRPVGTTKVAKQQQDLVKKKQDTAFSMWAGLGKK